MEAMLRYYASADDLETITCFFVFEDTREDPRNTPNPVVNLMESGYDAQATSE
ncbi:UNVERIFIED_CONTAM: hypothetical protein Slati_1857600 [Sesamum latifolium]|uniref:Uncharacterized protein n=1 Tax=Sesamum latifolium TaxID=2727402 RepID=A0AAW2WZE1_9LAMI